MAVFFLYSMALLYIAGGLYHFLNPNFYLRMMPSYIPWHKTMVYMSGVFEIILGVLLLPSGTRPWAAWGIIALLVAIFPANIQMAVNFYRQGNPYLWVAIIRLPFQLVLIWWASLYTHNISLAI